MKAKYIRKYRCLILILTCMLLFMACTPAYIEQEKPKPIEGVSEIEQEKPDLTEYTSENNEEDNLIDSSIEDTTEDHETDEGKVIDNIIKDDNKKEDDHTAEDDIKQVGEQDFVVTIEEQISYFEEKYADVVPEFWGERVKGVITEIDTADKVIALTFDACGGKSDGYDAEIIEFLVREGIPATLFINSHWIDKFPNEFHELAANPLFEIANHGYQHKPLSVTGKSAYGISGTKDIREVVEEVLLNHEKIFDLTGHEPKYFRSGTAFYDEIAVRIANDLGYQVVNYNVLGDAGATFNKDQIVKACSSASPGSIILFHMNRPETNIAEGIIEGITLLKNNGYTLVKLSDYHDFLK